jgi:hypothetical protein
LFPLVQDRFKDGTRQGIDFVELDNAVLGGQPSPCQPLRNA